MVLINLKRRDTSQFCYETSINNKCQDVAKEVTVLYNGCLKIQRICSELGELKKHGVIIPENMMGLTEEQIEGLHLKDEWSEICIPSGGFIENKDPIGRRNGKQPNQKMQDLINKSVTEVTAAISKKKVNTWTCLTQRDVADALDCLSGTVTIIYPMGLPPYDPVQMELKNQEDLSGQQASLEVIEESECVLWFAGKEMQGDKQLSDYCGANDKTKVTLKLQKKKEGAPAREPLMTEDERKNIMMQQYRRQEELKKLDEDDDDYDGQWNDTISLKRSLQGIKEIKISPR